MAYYKDPAGVRNREKFATAIALAAAIAVPAEGLRQWAYNDIANPSLLTVCYGSTTDVVPGVLYSLEECKRRLDGDMLQAVIQVDRCVPDAPVPVLAAFADAVYNMGPTIACDKTKSTAARLLADKSWTAACLQLRHWNKARVAGVLVELPGLTKRRKDEEAVCLSYEFSG